MAIDVHAHYLPASLLERLRQAGSDVGVQVCEHTPGCPCLRFDDGLQTRPFFPRLVEAPQQRMDRMAGTGIERQILSGWTDIFGFGLEPAKGVAWHRLMNETLAEFCQQHAARFSALVSGYLPDAASAARELERGVRELGAVGGVATCNVNGINLGELPLDEYWAAAVELDVPVFLHPMQPEPPVRVKRYALNQVAQYTFDTTLAVGSLIMSGVLDRHPGLRLILSHGGGAVLPLMGRFDCMYERSDHKATGIAAAQPPSAYRRRLYYDSIVHDPVALRHLVDVAGADRVVIGSDDSFPPADYDPMQSLRQAGLDAQTIDQIAQHNPRALFRLP